MNELLLLEQNLEALLKAYNELKEERNSLAKQVDLLQKELTEVKKSVEVREQIDNTVKLAEINSAKTEMVQRIDALVREIDECITHLK